MFLYVAGWQKLLRFFVMFELLLVLVSQKQAMSKMT